MKQKSLEKLQWQLLELSKAIQSYCASLDIESDEKNFLYFENIYQNIDEALTLLGNHISQYNLEYMTDLCQTSLDTCKEIFGDDENSGLLWKIDEALESLKELSSPKRI